MTKAEFFKANVPAGKHVAVIEKAYPGGWGTHSTSPRKAWTLAGCPKAFRAYFIHPDSYIDNVSAELLSPVGNPPIFVYETPG